MRDKFAITTIMGLTALLFYQEPALQPAATRINVGDSIVDGLKLQPYSNQWAMTRTSSDGTVLVDAGTWKDEITLVTMNGKSCLQRTQSASFKKGNGEIAAVTRNVNIFERVTLAPLLRIYEKHVAGGKDSKVTIKFKANSMTIETIENGTTQTREVPTSIAFDFYGGVYAVLWAALPLKEGFSATYPSYLEDEHPETISWVTMKVTGSEMIQTGPDKKRMALTVESDTLLGFLKYWITDERPYIMRMDFTQPDGTLWQLKVL